MSETKLEGAITAMITPFTQEGDVDHEGLRKNIQYQIEKGISGILVLGTTGETPALSEEEKEEIIKVAVEEAKGKVHVMVGTGTNNTAKSVEASKKAEELGADSILVVMPYYNKPMPDGIYGHFKAVDNAVNIPIVVYNVPSRTGKNIDTATMKRLAGLKNVKAVKEASGDINQIADVLDQIPELTVLSGDDGMTFPLMAFGGKGIISVASNLLPAEMSKLCSLMTEGNIEGARKLHFELLPFFKAEFIETNP